MESSDKMKKRESLLETYFVKRVKDIKGVTRKWVSPQHNGVPDRLLFYKGKVYLVELKTIDGILSSIQIREHELLKTQQIPVYVLCSRDEIDNFIIDIMN